MLYKTPPMKTDTMFRNVDTYNSDSGESPERKNTTFRTQRKFEIKKNVQCSYIRLQTLCQ
jgi:hypothetical protein